MGIKARIHTETHAKTVDIYAEVPHCYENNHTHDSTQYIRLSDKKKVYRNTYATAKWNYNNRIRLIHNWQDGNTCPDSPFHGAICDESEL